VVCGYNQSEEPLLVVCGYVTGHVALDFFLQPLEERTNTKEGGFQRQKKEKMPQTYQLSRVVGL